MHNSVHRVKGDIIVIVRDLVSDSKGGVRFISAKQLNENDVVETVNLLQLGQKIK